MALYRASVVQWSVGSFELLLHISTLDYSAGLDVHLSRLPRNQVGFLFCSSPLSSSLIIYIYHRRYSGEPMYWEIGIRGKHAI